MFRLTKLESMNDKQRVMPQFGIAKLVYPQTYQKKMSRTLDSYICGITSRYIELVRVFFLKKHT